MMRTDLRQRWSIAFRVLAAIIGGYAFTSLLTIAVSLLLPLLGVDRASGLLGATMTGFLIWTAIIMAVFHARSAVRVWIWLAAAALPLGLVVLLFLPGIGR